MFLMASNLERNLYLTIQLIEMKVPLIVVLNMIDIVKQKKINIDVEKLKESLDCPVVCTVANKGAGSLELKNVIHEAFHKNSISRASIYFPDEIEDAIIDLSEQLEEKKQVLNNNARWTAIKLLEGDIDSASESISHDVICDVQGSQKKIKSILGEDLGCGYWQIVGMDLLILLQECC